MKVIHPLRKLMAALPGAVLAYLIQATVMNYLAVGGVTGSVLFAYLAVILVSCGKKSVFIASSVIGILMESMLSKVVSLYIICYPLITMLWAQVFCDMTDRQREQRALLHPNRRQEDLPAMVRIPLSAACMCLTMQVVNLGYVYLVGNALTAVHFQRAFIQTVYTVALSVGLAFPVRLALGMYRKPAAGPEKGEPA